MILLQLYLEFFKIALFTFGGGYATLPLISESIIENRGWITAVEFADIIAMEGIAPGPLGINLASFVGTLIAGIPGAVVATLGICSPAMVICTLLAGFYQKYKEYPLMKYVLLALRPAAIGLIGSSAITVTLTALFNNGDGTVQLANFNFWSVVIFLAGLYCLRKNKLGELRLILIGFVTGVILYHFI